MDILRLVLFLGLIVHKLVWESLKGKLPSQNGEPPRALSWPKRLIKGVKTLALICLALQTLFPTILPISNDPATLQVIGTVIYGIGLATALLGRLQLGANWSNIEDARVESDQALVSSGIYHYIRHPIYAGDLLLIAGLELALNSWLVVGSLALLIYIVKRASVEEFQLSSAISGYAAYQSRTKRFIPFVL